MSKQNFKYKDRVKIVKGFYEGFEGLLESYNENKYFVAIYEELPSNNSSALTYGWIHEDNLEKL